MERRVILEQPRRRAVLKTEAPAGVVKADEAAAYMEQVDLFNQTPPNMRCVIPKDLLEVTKWTLGPCPPCSGWWDYTIAGTHEKGRLWFTTNGDADGVWCKKPFINKPVGVITRHSTVAGTMAWRGLTQPHPDGYPYPVPAPAKRTRAQLVL